MENVVLEAEDLVDVVAVLELLIGKELQYSRHLANILQQLGLLLQHDPHPGDHSPYHEGLDTPNDGGLLNPTDCSRECIQSGIWHVTKLSSTEIAQSLFFVSYQKKNVRRQKNRGNDSQTSRTVENWTIRMKVSFSCCQFICLTA
jgi:hypothetical protein